MTKLIHLVGKHGVGKTTLALNIIAGLHKGGASAISLVEEGLQYYDLFEHGHTLQTIRTLEHPHSIGSAPHRFDYLFVEHIDTLPEKIDRQKGDLIIWMERVE